jgi:hypothetical protein
MALVDRLPGDSEFLCVLCVLCVVVSFSAIRSMRSMRWDFFSLTYDPWQGPFQKVCRDTNTHASPQLPPGAAALGCFHGGAAM